MLITFRMLLCTSLLWFSCVYGHSGLGYMSYSSTNIGDDIQALAAIRLLKGKKIPIDREFISQYTSPSPVPTLMNGWFMHTKDCCWWSKNHAPKKSWPPSPCIQPLLISMYLEPSFFPQAFAPEGIAYFKKYGPVGTRDLHTLEELEKRGVPCYFSGCLTLTLDNRFTKRDDIIYAVDIDEASVNYIRSKTKSKVIAISHGVPLNIQNDNEKRLEYAQRLLNKYRRAKCVVTARLHAAMPCLAFETPVLMFGSPNARRFKGLVDLVHHCSSVELKNGEVDFDFDNPPANPRDYIPIRENLIKTVSAWVDQVEEAK